MKINFSQKITELSDAEFAGLNPKKIKHRMTVMMLYGILMFVFQMNSRRETNKEMTTPQLLKNLQASIQSAEDF